MPTDVAGECGRSQWQSAGRHVLGESARGKHGGDRARMPSMHGLRLACGEQTVTGGSACKTRVCSAWSVQAIRFPGVGTQHPLQNRARITPNAWIAFGVWRADSDQRQNMQNASVQCMPLFGDTFPGPGGYTRGGGQGLGVNVMTFQCMDCSIQQCWTQDSHQHASKSCPDPRAWRGRRLSLPGPGNELRLGRRHSGVGGGCLRMWLGSAAAASGSRRGDLFSGIGRGQAWRTGRGRNMVNLFHCTDCSFLQ